MSAEATAQSVLQLHGQIQSLEQQLLDTSNKLLSVLSQLEEQKKTNNLLRSRKASKEHAYNAILKQIKRIRSKKTQISKDLGEVGAGMSVFSLKTRSGTIKPAVRDMLRKLMCEGVSTEQALDIIKIIADCLEVRIIGSISPRAVSLIMLEGLVKSKMQVAHELNHVKRK